jgi:hypothetical protein
MRTDSINMRRMRRDAPASSSAHARRPSHQREPRLAVGQLFEPRAGRCELAGAHERLERLVTDVGIAVRDQAARELAQPRRRAGEHGAEHRDAHVGDIAARALGDQLGCELAVDREPRDQLHRAAAHLRRGIAVGERAEQLELAMPGQHDREVPAHAGIGILMVRELADVTGRAQRERPDRPHALLGTAVLEQLAQLDIAEHAHVLEAFDAGHS